MKAYTIAVEGLSYYNKGYLKAEIDKYIPFLSSFFIQIFKKC